VSKASTRFQPGLSVRGDPRWIAWVRRAAAKEQRSCSSLLERVLFEWAQANGLPDPPPRQGGERAEMVEVGELV
jgi:hypothetical protein